MWVPVDVPAADIVATIRSTGGPILEDVRLLDEYRPESEARRSLAFALTFRAPDRTLRAEEADAARTAIAEACRERCGAEIR
jgi:phenylalanyl-tRNA synthetase beta chain